MRNTVFSFMLAAACLLLTACPSEAATVTLTGNIQDLTGVAPTSSTFVRFALQNCGSNIPRVNGVAVMGAKQKDVRPNAAGAISDQIYGNSDIECGGVIGTTYYTVSIYSGTLLLFQADFQICRTSVPGNCTQNVGTTFDITTAAALSPTPPSSIYDWAARNASNTYTSTTTQDLSGAAVTRPFRALTTAQILAIVTCSAGVDYYTATDAPSGQNIYVCNSTGTAAVLAAGQVLSTRAINTTAPLTGGGDLSADRTLSIPKADSTHDGYLSQTDWGTFNNKASISGNTFGGSQLPGINDFYDLGSTTFRWAHVYAYEPDAYLGYTYQGAAPAGHYLRGDGSHYLDSAIQAADLPPISVAALTDGASVATKAGVQQQSYEAAADTGAANAYAVCPSPAPTVGTYSVIVFKAVAANTGASTLAVCGGAANPIVKRGGSIALVANDILAGAVVRVVWDGAQWQMTSQLGNANKIETAADYAGSSETVGDGVCIKSLAPTQFANCAASLPANPQTGVSYTITSSDLAKDVAQSNAAAITDTVPDATGASGSFPDGFYFWVSNDGATNITVNRTTASTFTGATFGAAATSGTIIPGESCRFESKSSNWLVRCGFGQHDHSDAAHGGQLAAAAIPNSAVTLPKLANQAADTVVMNASAGSAAPTAVALPTSGTNGCSGATDTLQYNNSTHTFACGTAGGATGVSRIFASCGGTVGNTNGSWYVIGPAGNTGGATACNAATNAVAFPTMPSGGTASHLCATVQTACTTGLDVTLWSGATAAGMVASALTVNMGATAANTKVCDTTDNVTLNTDDYWAIEIRPKQATETCKAVSVSFKVQ